MTMKSPKIKTAPPTSMPTTTLCNTKPVATPIRTASAMNAITRPMGQIRVTSSSNGLRFAAAIHSSGDRRSGSTGLAG